MLAVSEESEVNAKVAAVLAASGHSKTNVKRLPTPMVKPPRPALDFPVVWVSDAQMPENQPAVVKGLLEAGALGVVYGEPGTGKTFFVQDLALHVAAGMEWRGRKVKRGLVVYIAAEAGTSILKRFIGWRDRKLGESAEKMPLAILTRGPNLLASVEVEKLCEQLSTMADTSGLPVVLVVIDTLSRSIHGGDENKAEDMTMVVAAAEAIRDDFGAATVFVHHSGKDTAKGARGHSALVAAADLVMLVKDHSAAVEKVRDGVAGEQFPFSLKVVELGVDADGDPVTTCVVAEKDSSTANRPARRISGVGQIALQALKESITEHGQVLPASSTIPQGVRGVRIGDWRERFTLRYGSDGDRESSAVRKAFQRGRESLLHAAVVGISDPYVWLG